MQVLYVIDRISFTAAVVVADMNGRAGVKLHGAERLSRVGLSICTIFHKVSLIYCPFSSERTCKNSIHVYTESSRNIPPIWLPETRKWHYNLYDFMNPNGPRRFPPSEEDLFDSWCTMVRVFSAQTE
jgi:hypothetical protein